MTDVRPERVTLSTPGGRGSDPEAAEELRRCVRALLGAAGDRATPWSLSGDLPAARFQAMVTRHRLVPFLHTHAGRLALPDDLTSWLRERGDAYRLQCLVMARELFRALDVLERAEVSVLVVKGLALAQDAHGDLAARGPGDLDLLVRPREAGRAHRALTEAGWQSPPGYADPAQERVWDYAVRIGYEHPFVGPASMVDLHWRLDPTLRGFADFDTLWASRTSVQVAGRTVPTLGRWHAVAHSCSHAAKDDWKWLRSLVDLSVLSGIAELWSGAPVRLTRPQLASLGVTFELLGTADAVPAELRRAAATAAEGVLPSVRRRQAVVATFPRSRFPGAGSLSAVRRWSRGSWAPSDLRRVVQAAAVPSNLLGELAHHSPPAAVVTLVRLRLRRARLWFRPKVSPPVSPSP